MEENKNMMQEPEGTGTGPEDDKTSAGVIEKIKEALGLGVAKSGKKTEPEKPEDKKPDEKNKPAEEKKLEKTFTEADIEAAKEEARKQLLAEQEEEKRRAKLSPEEKEAEDKKKAEAHTKELEAKILKMELEKKAGDLLKEKRLPAGLLRLLNFESEDKLKESLDTVDKVYKEELQTGVNEKLKGKTPKGLGPSGNIGEELMTAEIRKRVRGGF